MIPSLFSDGEKIGGGGEKEASALPLLLRDRRRCDECEDQPNDSGQNKGQGLPDSGMGGLELDRANGIHFSLHAVEYFDPHLVMSARSGVVTAVDSLYLCFTIGTLGYFGSLSVQYCWYGDRA